MSVTAWHPFEEPWNEFLPSRGASARVFICAPDDTTVTATPRNQCVLFNISQILLDFLVIFRIRLYFKIFISVILLRVRVIVLLLLSMSI